MLVVLDSENLLKDDETKLQGIEYRTLEDLIPDEIQFLSDISMLWPLLYKNLVLKYESDGEKIANIGTNLLYSTDENTRYLYQEIDGRLPKLKIQNGERHLAIYSMIGLIDKLEIADGVHLWDIDFTLTGEVSGISAGYSY